jgi:hypothetical protein
MKTINVYQKNYSIIREQESITDVYSQLKDHNVDPIPLKKWLTLQANNDQGYLLQKTISAKEDEKTSWKFIYSKYVNTDSSFYSIKVMVTTKDKQMQKLYGR